MLLGRQPGKAFVQGGAGLHHRRGGGPGAVKRLAAGDGLERDFNFVVQLALLDNPEYTQLMEPGQDQRVGDHGQHQDLHVREVSL
ncbi:hypothetical protein D9M71_655670 [compost metagenome]